MLPLIEAFSAKWCNYNENLTAITTLCFKNLNLAIIFKKSYEKSGRNNDHLLILGYDRVPDFKEHLVELLQERIDIGPDFNYGRRCQVFQSLQKESLETKLQEHLSERNEKQQECHDSQGAKEESIERKSVRRKSSLGSKSSNFSTKLSSSLKNSELIYASCDFSTKIKYEQKVKNNIV